MLPWQSNVSGALTASAKHTATPTEPHYHATAETALAVKPITHSNKYPKTQTYGSGAEINYPGDQHMPRGGKRKGAGAPRANLNALARGRRSKQLHQAIENALEDPKGRAQVLALVRKFERTKDNQETKHRTENNG